MRPVWMVAAITAISSPIAAQTGVPAANVDLARAIAIDAYSPDATKAAYIDSFIKSFDEGMAKNPQVAALFTQRPTVREAALAAAREEVSVQFDKTVAPALTSALADVYRESFTNDELVAIAAYHRTSEAKRLLRSFTQGPAEIAEAQSTPVVRAYQASPEGIKEKQLSARIANAMTASMTSVVPVVNGAVLPKVKAAFVTAMGAKP